MIQVLWVSTTAIHRGSDWAVLALGYRLALGVATSIFSTRARPAKVTSRACSRWCSVVRCSVKTETLLALPNTEHRTPNTVSRKQRTLLKHIPRPQLKAAPHGHGDATNLR